MDAHVKNLSNSITIFGTGPITFGALIPTVCSTTDKDVIVFTRNEAWRKISKCRLTGGIEEIYAVTYADKTVQSLDELLQKMRKSGSRVAIVDVNHKIADEVLRKDNLFFSACRTGITDTYLPRIMDLKNEQKEIVLFDNDKSILKTAKNVCTNPFIHLQKATVHCVCVLDDFNYEDATVTYTRSSEAIIVFPPEMISYEKVFRENIFDNPVQLIFTKTMEEYECYLKWKLICINAIHSLCCVKAYLRGHEIGLSIQQTAEMAWNDVISVEELLKHALRVESILYKKYIKKYESIMDMDETLCKYMTMNFIKGLYSFPKETIGRGLMPGHVSYSSKVESHFPLLKSSEDMETVEIMDAFLGLL